MDKNSIWRNDWDTRLEEAIFKRGFDTITDFLVSIPAKPYEEVIEQLGIDAAPIQLISVQFREAKSQGKMREAAKDSLCRNIVEKFPKGWKIGEDSDWQEIRMLSGWCSEITVTGESPELKEILRRVMDHVRKTSPPKGWLPKSIDDPVILQIFDAEWPIN